MTVTFLDPQFPARLPSRNETLDFTITTPVADATVTMRHESGAWETIYQGGQFALKYYGSTLDGSTFHVVRAGGWPEGRWSVPVSEAPAAPSTLWEVLEDIDFTALATTSMHTAQADTTFSLGGYTWNVANSIGGAPGQGNVNGSGFRLLSNGRAWASGASQTGSHLSLPLSALTGYSSSKKQAILGVVDTGLGNANNRVAVGHWHPNNSAAAAGSQALTASSQVSTGLRYIGASNFRVNFNGLEVTDGLPGSTQLAAITVSANWVFGAIRHSDAYGEGVFAPYSGTIPDLEDVKSAGGVDTSYSAGSLYGGVGFGCNGGGLQTCFVRRLVFLQET